MNVTGLWTKLGSELADDPLLVVALTAALVAIATTPIAFAVLGRLDWFKARRGRVMQRPEFSSIVVGMMLVMAIPAIFAALVLKSRYFDKNRYEFDPNKTWSVLEQGRGFKSLQEADAAVKGEMERLARRAEEPGRQRQEARRGHARPPGRRRHLARRGPGVPDRAPVAGRRPQERGRRRSAATAWTSPRRPSSCAARAGLDGRRLRCDRRHRPPAPAARASPPAPAPAGNGLTPAQVEAELAAVPEPQKPIAAMLPLTDLPPAGPWASRATSTSKRSTPRTSTRRSTAGPRASSQYGVKGMAYTFYHPTGDPSNELQLYIFEMADPLKALGKYGSEKPDEAKTVAVGTEGYTAAGSTLFYAGKYYTQIVSTKDDPKFAAFAAGACQAVAAKQKPEESRAGRGPDGAGLQTPPKPGGEIGDRAATGEGDDEPKPAAANPRRRGHARHLLRLPARRRQAG